MNEGCWQWMMVQMCWTSCSLWSESIWSPQGAPPGKSHLLAKVRASPAVTVYSRKEGVKPYWTSMTLVGCTHSCKTLETAQSSTWPSAVHLATCLYTFEFIVNWSNPFSFLFSVWLTINPWALIHHSHRSNFQGVTKVPPFHATLISHPVFPSCDFHFTPACLVDSVS